MSELAASVIRSTLLGAFLLALTCAPLAAHPDVWVTSASEVLYAADGSATGVRHAWTFDEGFSKTALEGVANKSAGVYTREDLATLAKINVQSLKEFSFFTFAKADGRKQRFVEPADDYYLEYVGSALVLHFTLPFRTPFKARQLALEIFDPTSFVAFSLRKDDPVRLVGAPAACRVSVQWMRDNDERAAARQPADSESHDAPLVAAVPDKITVDCP